MYPDYNMNYLYYGFNDFNYRGAIRSNEVRS